MPSTTSIRPPVTPSKSQNSRVKEIITVMQKIARACQTKESEDTGVKEDVAEFTATVSGPHWLHIACGVDPDRKDGPVFLQDEAIAKELDTFGEAQIQTARYVPPSRIIVRLLKLVQEHSVDATTARRLDHVPELAKLKDLWHLSSDIRSLFDAAPHPDKDRVPRCLLMNHSTPLSEKLVQAPNSLITMAKQVITCIHDLRYKGLILHCDVSEGNIMYQKRGSEDYFVLVDIDSGVGLDENGFPKEATPRHRTGTLPFMALELIQDMQAAEEMDSECERVIHCVRHDYESVLWVTLWCAIKIADPNAPDKYAKFRVAELAEWEFGTYKQIANNKLVVLMQANQSALRLSPLFEHLRRWIMAFKTPFGNSAIMKLTQLALIRSNQQELKDSFETFETSGGLITYEKLLATFEGF
ncbi:hypothetical protein BC835DRAFT_1520876 [Cytidiella melzeri]|nr:hypothetical protein BC835DRAFT_1520876 [Cytidiella melzeri]